MGRGLVVKRVKFKFGAPTKVSSPFPDTVTVPVVSHKYPGVPSEKVNHAKTSFLIRGVFLGTMDLSSWETTSLFLPKPDRDAPYVTVASALALSALVNGLVWLHISAPGPPGCKGGQLHGYAVLLIKYPFAESGRRREAEIQVTGSEIP